MMKRVFKWLKYVFVAVVSVLAIVFLLKRRNKGFLSNDDSVFKQSIKEKEDKLSGLEKQETITRQELEEIRKEKKKKEEEFKQELQKIEVEYEKKKQEIANTDFDKAVKHVSTVLEKRLQGHQQDITRVMKDKIFEEAKKIIKAFEGLYLKAYKDPVGIWTIGYGHVIDVNKEKELLERAITEKEAEVLLEKDMERIWNGMWKFIKIKLEDMHVLMWAALLSFCFNVGYGALQKSIGKALNEKNFEAVADEFPKWVYAGGKVLKGLVRRRDYERQVFLNGLKELRAGNVLSS